MKKLSLILLCSAFTVFGMAQTTQEKSEIKQNTELKTISSEASKIKKEDVKPKASTLNVKKLQNKDMILKQKEAMTTLPSKSEAIEVKKKTITEVSEPK